MKKTITFLLFATLSISLHSQWGKTIKGNGTMTTDNRSVGDYESIGVSGWFDVELVSGEEGKLELKGESNLLEHVVTSVSNGKLSIKVEKGYNLKPSKMSGGISIIVPVDSIDAVALSGSGDIVGKTTIKTTDFKTSMSGSGDISLDIQAESISAAMSGSGDIVLSGRTGDFDATISGSGDIKAYDLEADHVEATISGSADIKITVNESLKARVSGSGDISYKGNPKKVDTKTSGSGDITKA